MNQNIKKRLRSAGPADIEPCAQPISKKTRASAPTITDNNQSTERVFIKPFTIIRKKPALPNAIITALESFEQSNDFHSEGSDLSLKASSIMDECSSVAPEILSQLHPKYTPIRMLFREKEIEEITQTLRECVSSNKGENIFLSGQPGTGKTCSINYILSSLEKEGLSFLTSEPEKKKTKSNKKQIKILKLNAMNFKNTKEMFGHLIENLSDKAPIDRSRFKSDQLIQEVKDLVDNNNCMSTILFVDEFDYLFSKPQYALDMIQLYNSCSRLIIISVSNSMESIVKMSKKLKMSDNYKHIVFQPYNFNQIYEILKERTNNIDDTSSQILFQEQSILFCAKKLYNLKGGDIRACLEVLLKAANQSLDVQSKLMETESSLNLSTNSNSTANSNSSSVSIHDIKQFCEEVENNKFEEIFTTLPINQQVLVLTLHNQCKRSENPLVNIKDLLKSYNAHCSALYLPKLEINDLLDMATSFEDYAILKRTSAFAQGKLSLGKIEKPIFKSSPFKSSPFKATEFKTLIPVHQLSDCLSKNEMLSRFL